MLKIFISSLLFCCTFDHAFADAYPGHQQTYRVSITNITPGQTFTPQLLFTHARPQLLFALGEAASTEVEMMAEGGDTGPLATLISEDAIEIKTTEGLLAAGETSSVLIHGKPGRYRSGLERRDVLSRWFLGRGGQYLPLL